MPPPVNPPGSTARDLRLFHLLQQIAHRLQKRADREIGAETDLTTAQAAVLSVLIERGACTQQQVAAALGQNKSALTAMVNRLLALDYVRRQRSESDARAWRLEITPTGRRVHRRAGVPFARVNALIETALSDEEHRQLADMLGRLLAAEAQADDEP